MCRRDLVLTGKCLYLIGRDQIKKGPEKGKSIQVVKRKLPFNQISHVSLSTLQVIIISRLPYYCPINAYILKVSFFFQDNFVIIHTKEDYASLLELIFKTEFLSVLNKKYLEDIGHSLNIKFSNKYAYFISYICTSFAI